MGKGTRQQRFQRLQKVAETSTAYALELVRDFLADYPDHVGGLKKLGIALVEMARYEEARRVFRKAISLMPKDLLYLPYYQLGHLYREKGDYKRAVSWYRRALKIAPDEGTSHIFLGAALAKKGRFQEALKCHQRALQCSDVVREEAYFNIGSIRRAQERYEEASECFRKALEIAPKYVEAKRGLSDVVAAIKIVGKRAQHLAQHGAKDIRRYIVTGTAHTLERARDFLADYPDHPGALIELGIMLVKMARYEEAQRVFLKVISRAPKDYLRFPYSQLGLLYYEKGDYRRAISWYRRALENSPDNGGPLILLGGALAIQGRFQEAVKCHQLALQCSEGSKEEAYLNIGLIRRAQERYEEASECFRKALEIDPKYVDAKRELADVVVAIKIVGKRAQHRPQRDADDRACLQPLK